MKIDYVFIGSDLNPMYLDFWPIISRIWREVFNMTPVLGLICDEDSDFYDDGCGLVKRFKAIEGINTGLQSQIVRLYMPKFLEGNILLSDIDMAPLSKNYFIEKVKDFDQSKFYVFSADNPECLANSEYPICYNLGHSSSYNKIFDLDKSWESFVKELDSMNMGWGTDQRFLFKKLNEYERINPNSVVLMERGWCGPAKGRIDRLAWKYDSNLVKEGHYIDSHLLRPYSAYKPFVDDLLKNILQ